MTVPPELPGGGRTPTEAAQNRRASPDNSTDQTAADGIAHEVIVHTHKRAGQYHNASDPQNSAPGVGDPQDKEESRCPGSVAGRKAAVGFAALKWKKAKGIVLD